MNMPSTPVPRHYSASYRQTPQSILKRLDRPFSSRLVQKEKNVRFQSATWALPPGNDMNSLSNLMHGSSRRQPPTPARSTSLRHRRPTPWLTTFALPADDFHTALNSPNQGPLLFAQPGNRWNDAEPDRSFFPNSPSQYQGLPKTPKSSPVPTYPKEATNFLPHIPQDDFHLPDYPSLALAEKRFSRTPALLTTYLPSQSQHIQRSDNNHAVDYMRGIPKPRGTHYTTPVMPLSPLPGFPASPSGFFSQPCLTMVPPGTPVIPCLLVPSAVYSDPGANYDRSIIPRRPDEEDDPSNDDPESRVLRDEMLFNAQISWDVRLPPSSAITQTPDPRDWSRTLPVNLGTTALDGVMSVRIGFYDIKHWRISDNWGDIEIQQSFDSPISTGQILEAIFKYFFEPLTTVDLANLSMSRTEQSFVERARLERERLWGSGLNLYRRSDLLYNTRLFSKLYLKHSTSKTCQFSLSIR